MTIGALPEMPLSRRPRGRQRQAASGAQRRKSTSLGSAKSSMQAGLGPVAKTEGTYPRGRLGPIRAGYEPAAARSPLFDPAACGELGSYSWRNVFDDGAKIVKGSR